MNSSSKLDDLSFFGVKYMTDKTVYEGDQGIYHSYTIRYEQLMRSMRECAKSILEIGVQRGASLKMWRDYFWNAQIYGIDKDDCSQFLIGEERIHFHWGDGTVDDCLTKIIDVGQPFDLVVDDGSHEPKDMIASLKILYPFTAGIYIIEDVHTGWWGNQMREAVKQITGHVAEELISKTDPLRAAFIIDKRC